MLGGNHSRQASGGAAVTVRFSVTVRQVREDGSEVPLEGELAAALAAPAEQFAGLAAWAADEAGYLDHGEREKVIGQEGRELLRRLLQATFGIDSAREERADGVTSAAGIQHGTVEAGHGRGVTSVFGPVRATRLAYRSRREPNLYPADARQVLPGDPYSLGMRSLAALHLAAGGFGQAQEVIEARTGVTVGRAQLTGLAEDLAAWTDDFYAERARDADEDLPGTDVIMMQGDGKGIALRPEHRRNPGKDDGTRPGIKKMAEIVAVADFTPAARQPEDIAAPPARRRAHPARRPGTNGYRPRSCSPVNCIPQIGLIDELGDGLGVPVRRHPGRAADPEPAAAHGHLRRARYLQPQLACLQRPARAFSPARMTVHLWLSPALSMTQFKEETVLVHPVVVPGSGTRSWTVPGDDDVPVAPVGRFLAYLTGIGRSPDTVKAYSHDLRDYWEFLGFCGLDWREARLEDVGEFAAWLQLPPAGRAGGVAVLPSAAAQVTAATVNRKLSVTWNQAGETRSVI
jgi:Phage integrase, N-terminal SAM-like domain